MRNKKNIKQEYIFKAKVVRVIDGDTIDIDIPMGFGITKTKSGADHMVSIHLNPGSIQSDSLNGSGRKRWAFRVRQG